MYKNTQTHTDLCSAEILGLRVVQAGPHRQLSQARRAVDGRGLHRGRGVLDHWDLHTAINTALTEQYNNYQFCDANPCSLTSHNTYFRSYYSSHLQPDHDNGQELDV